MAIAAPIQFKYGSLEASALTAAATAVGAVAAPSRVRGRIGVAELPGSPVVLDWETDTMLPCDTARCPFAVPINTRELLVQPAVPAAASPHLSNSSSASTNTSVATNSSSSSNATAGATDAGTTWVNMAPYTSWVGNVAYVNAKKSAQEQLATFVLFAQVRGPREDLAVAARAVCFYTLTGS
jgi:hypothetical protein